MPYPSRACLRCKQARVKCDEIRPSCSRCLKKALFCPGYESPTPPFSLFVDENPYAGGTLRKPRKRREDLSRVVSLAERADQTGIGLDTFPSNKRNDDYFVKIAVRRGAQKIPPTLEIPAETQALSYFDYHYLMSSPLSYEKAMWAHLNDYRQQWENDAPDTMLGLAVSSLVYALFNHMYPESGLAVTSYRRHNMAIKKISQALHDTEQVTSDQLILAVMAASYYEGASDNKGLHSPFDSGFRHQQGAITLLCMRRGQTRERNTALERSIRAQLACIARVIFLLSPQEFWLTTGSQVSHAILQGKVLPEPLQDGARYGLESMELELDSCLIQLPILKDRYRCWRGHGSKPNEAKTIHQYAKTLDRKLVHWATTIPSYWLPQENTLSCDIQHATQRVSFPGVGCFPRVQIYTDFDHSVSWNLYRAARLIVLEIVQATAPTTDVVQKYLINAESVKLVDDICASVPYHFGCADFPFRDYGRLEIIRKTAAVRARAVGTLVVPLISAICKSATPIDTKLWLKQQLKEIGEIMSNRAIRQFVERI